MISYRCHQGDKALGDLKDYHVCRVLDNPRVKFEIGKKIYFFLLKRNIEINIYLLL